MRASRRRVCSSWLDLEPVLEQDDPGVDHGLLDRRRHLEEPLRLLVGAEAHHPLDAGPVVPAAVEDHDLPAGREVRQVALHVHLGLLALGRRREGDHAEHPRADPLGDALDDPALAGGVAALEDDADLGAGRAPPTAAGGRARPAAGQLALVRLAAELAAAASCASWFLPCLCAMVSVQLGAAIGGGRPRRPPPIRRATSSCPSCPSSSCCSCFLSSFLLFFLAMDPPRVPSLLVSGGHRRRRSSGRSAERRVPGSRPRSPGYWSGSPSGLRPRAMATRSPTETSRACRRSAAVRLPSVTSRRRPRGWIRNSSGVSSSSASPSTPA